MSSICGRVNFLERYQPDIELLQKMGQAMKHRGGDDEGTFIFNHCGFHHNRRAGATGKNCKQPMSVTHKGSAYTIVFDGEIFNCDKLRQSLHKNHGVVFKSNCDAEVVLYCYIIFGKKCAEYLNGFFAFCILDLSGNKIFFARDRFGVKPFFYNLAGRVFSFASEVKALLRIPEIKPEIDRRGLWQLLFLAPAKIEGETVFRRILELPPAACGEFSASGLFISKYFEIKPKKVDITPREAATHLRELLFDAVDMQLSSQTSLCGLLSGGLDSSVLTAIAARSRRRQGAVLDTYSFEYRGNKQNFSGTLFQPQGDDDFATFAALKLGTKHTVLTVPTEELIELLYAAAYYRDLPGQADIDSSLLYFCGEIKKRHNVVVTGEGADEIFGGYPWFYRKEMLFSEFFPFIHDPLTRVKLFRREIAHPDEGYGFMSALYKRELLGVKYLESDGEADRTARVAAHFTQKYFMANLLERTDRMTCGAGVQARLPFCDHNILEFVQNIPWEIKFEGGVEKALLRNAMKGILPEKILWRKKSPFPKTHNPEYERLVAQKLSQRLQAGAPIAEMLDFSAYKALLKKENVTWFGQLMGKPQLLAWLLQFDYFLEEYGCLIV